MCGGTRGVELSSAAVTVARRQLAHAARDAKGERRAALDDADWDRLPAILAAPEAVLLDTRKGGGRVLLFTFEPSDREGRKGKVVVRVEFSVRHRGRTRVANSIRSSGSSRRPTCRRLPITSRWPESWNDRRRSETQPSVQSVDRLRRPTIYRESGLAVANYPAYPAAAPL